VRKIFDGEMVAARESGVHRDTEEARKLFTAEESAHTATQAGLNKPSSKSAEVPPPLSTSKP